MAARRKSNGGGRKAGRKPARQNAPLANAAPAKPEDDTGRAADDVEDLIKRNGGETSTGAERVLHELLAHSMLVVRELSTQRVRYSNDSSWIKQFNEACEQSAAFSKQLHAATPPPPNPDPKEAPDVPPEEKETKQAGKVQLA